MLKTGRGISGAGVSIATFRQCFPDEAACLAYVFYTRHGPRPRCPKCGRIARFGPFPNGPGYASSCCWGYLSATGGTILARTNVRIWPWFYALLLYANATAGMSHNPLRRLLGLSQGAADRLADGLRTHMALSLDDGQLGGWGRRVYIDECGIWFGRQKRYAIVLGLTDGERLVLRIIPDRKAVTLLPIVAELVAPGSIVVTDGHAGYRRVNRLGFTHSQVNHTRKMWVNEGGNSTSQIETVWRVTKRLLAGRKAFVSEANLWKFLGEIMYRYNTRSDRAGAWWRLIGAFPPVDAGVLERARCAIDVPYRTRVGSGDGK